MPNNWPNQDESSMKQFYGPVGIYQAKLILPYPLRLAWDLGTTIDKISCHEKAHDSLKRILQKTLDHYGLEKIQQLRLDVFGGCLNVRKMRGGTQWSIHSWGVAFDIDPEHNQLKWGRDKAALDGPEYSEFWKIVFDEKWISYGHSRNYDWMHFQAANL